MTETKNQNQAQQTKIYYGLGRRKTSTARVWMRPGKGIIRVNKRPIDEYFPREILRKIIMEPLILTKMENLFNIKVNVRGGGLSGQAGAIRLGISRALLEYDPTLRPILKKEGLLTRDARMKERKKYGLHGARRGMQYSKR